MGARPEKDFKAASRRSCRKNFLVLHRMRTYYHSSVIAIFPFRALQNKFVRNESIKVICVDQSKLFSLPFFRGTKSEVKFITN